MLAPTLDPTRSAPELHVHDIVRQILAGTPPKWTEAGESRLQHMRRVGDLLRAWAEALGLDEGECVRWEAAGRLHDLLRDADPEVLRSRVPPALSGWAGPLLHGPAAAERLRVEGVDDGELLTAVAFHTVGDPRFGRLGRALYAADFLEPGRSFLEEWRAELSARMPDDLDGVVMEIARARISNRLDRGDRVLPRTLDFWNSLVDESR